MGVFYGRSQIRERARALVERACGGAGAVLLFRGEPGIGKSHAAEYVAAEGHALGAAVAMGRSWEAGGAPAYWPWIQVFRDLGMEQDPFSEAPTAPSLGGPEARFAAFDRAVRALRAQAAARPLVLVLDDLHAADAPSLQLLLLLARQVSRAPLLVVGAYRDAELELQPTIAQLMAAIAREAVVVPLQRLRPDAVAEWLRDAEPGGRADSTQLFQLTEGHPLFVVEALRLGHGAPPSGWSLGRGGVLDERLGQLTPTTRALLSAAAVFGRELTSAALISLTQDSTPSRCCPQRAARGAAHEHSAAGSRARKLQVFSRALARSLVRRAAALDARGAARAGRARLARARRRRPSRGLPAVRGAERSRPRASGGAGRACCARRADTTRL